MRGLLGCRRHWRGTAVSFGILAAFALPASGQVVGDHNLAGASVVERNGCSILQIEFYGRVQMHSHFPAATGDELRINLKLLDQPAGPGDAKGPAATPKPPEPKGGTRREQLRAPANERAAVNNIELESAGIDQILNIYFRHAVAFRVGPGRDPRTLLVAIAGRTANAACLPVLEDGGNSSNAGAASVPKTVGQKAPGALDADIAEARTAMSKAEHDRAIAYLTRVTEAGATKHLAEALELLGLAREQKGYVAHARADYQNYLKQFPTGEGHARVQQRLAALDKRELAKAQGPTATPVAPGVSTKLEGKPVAGGGGAVIVGDKGPGLRPGVVDGGRGETVAPNAWNVTHSGSLSTYYNLNQGGRDYFVRPNLQQGWDKESINQVYRNSTLSIGDYDGVASNAFYAARLHFSASQEHRFTDSTDEMRISTLTFEGKNKETGSSVRVGRQTHYGGGILGRFDGGLATVPFSNDWKMRLYGGSPVERSSDRPFLFDRVFYGASVDYSVNKKLDVGAFVIEQKTEQFLDRRAVGGEARYIDEMRHGYGAIDYDVNFNEINSVFGTGTLNLADKSSITGLLDYRRSPTMFTTNALQGQIETSLQDLLRRYTMHEIEDLARDRTPKSTVASVAYSRYLREKLQATAELTITNMSAMPASGGVAWAPSTGWDTYTMLQLMAMDVFRENDSVTGSIRYAATQSANRTLLEGSVRLPMSNPNWRTGPMLRLGYSDYKFEPIKEYIIHPMLRTSYNLTPNMLFEFEIGKRWTMRDSDRGRENETDLLLLTGLRYDFHSSR